MKPLSIRPLFAFTLFGVACVGTVTPGGERPGGASGAGGSPGSGGRGGTTQVTGGTGGTVPGTVDPPAACGQSDWAAPWHSTLLTREQYINAASDLLGFDVRPHATFSDPGGRKFTPGVSLSSLQVEERQQAADAIARQAGSPAHLARLLPCDATRAADAACVGRFIEGLGARAFRRPLTADTIAALRRLFDAGQAAGGPSAGLEWTVTGLLQAPDFLYQTAPVPMAAGSTPAPGSVVSLDDHTVANRLAFFLWNSPPDADLRAVADRGGLRTADGIRQQVQRMLGDARSVRMRQDYYSSWLKLDDLSQVGRDAPEYTAALGAELRQSVLQAIEHLYRNGAKLDSLLGDSTLFVNEALGKVYGLTVASPGAGGALSPVAADPGQRRGILTHPAMMTFLAHPDASDPIKRGVFIQEELLCQLIPDPVPDIPDLPPLRPGLSTRQRLEQHRADPSCAPCHQLFDPIGMAFENYDQIGRYRQTDQGVAVDSSGELRLGSDLDGPFAAGMDLIRRLPGSPAVRDCMVRRWFEYAVSRELESSQACALEPLKARFRSDGDLVELLAGIASSETFRSRAVPQP